MMPPVLVTPAEEMPVTLDEVRAAVPGSADTADAVLNGLVATAVRSIEENLNRALVPQIWRQGFDAFDKIMRLPLPAVEDGIGSITYRNEAGQIATVSDDDYALDADEIGSFVRFKDDFETPGDLYENAAVSITWTAGYADVSSGVDGVPPPIKTAILLVVGNIFRLTKPSLEIRMEEFPGAGETQYSSPEIVSRATDNVVKMLLGPFRRYV
jgi:uncharacterized phiE125 gp8 family phage protein